MSPRREEIVESLDAILASSTVAHPTTSRFQTLKAMVVLGDRWVKPNEVMRQLKVLKINTNYVYEIAGKYPTIVEIDGRNDLVRIRSDAFKLVASLLDDYIRRIESLTTK